METKRKVSTKKCCSYRRETIGTAEPDIARAGRRETYPAYGGAAQSRQAGEDGQDGAEYRQKGFNAMEDRVNEEKKWHQLPDCPVETTLMLIGSKWKVLILRDLMPGTKRFGELKRSLGHVTQKVLTAQLREMEADGLLTRQVYAEVPPRVEYTLTELGYSLQPVLSAMWEWGEGYKKHLRWQKGCAGEPQRPGSREQEEALSVSG